jgi:hypothetical protein
MVENEKKKPQSQIQQAREREPITRVTGILLCIDRTVKAGFTAKSCGA